MDKPEKTERIKVISFSYKYDSDNPIKCEICGKETAIYYTFKFSDGTQDMVCPECYLLDDKYPKGKKYLIPTQGIAFSVLKVK